MIEIEVEGLLPTESSYSIESDDALTPLVNQREQVKLFQLMENFLYLTEGGKAFGKYADGFITPTNNIILPSIVSTIQDIKINVSIQPDILTEVIHKAQLSKLVLEDCIFFECDSIDNIDYRVLSRFGSFCTRLPMVMYSLNHEGELVNLFFNITAQKLLTSFRLATNSTAMVVNELVNKGVDVVVMQRDVISVLEVDGESRYTFTVDKFDKTNAHFMSDYEHYILDDILLFKIEASGEQGISGLVDCPLVEVLSSGDYQFTKGLVKSIATANAAKRLDSK